MSNTANSEAPDWPIETCSLHWIGLFHFDRPLPKDQWIAANAKLMEVGPHTYLATLFGNAETTCPSHIGVDFGFSWTAVVRPDGTTAITSLDLRATFTDEYKLEISEDFPGNYKTVIPEPATYLLLSTGAFSSGSALVADVLRSLTTKLSGLLCGMPPS